MGLSLIQQGSVAYTYKAEIYCILQVVYYFDSFCHFVVVVSVVSVWSLGSFRFCRFGDFACLVLFVSFVPFQSFRFAVSGFSTCQLKGCNVVCVKFPTAVYCTQFTWANNCMSNSYCSFIQKPKHEGNILLLYFTVMFFFSCKI